MEAHRIGVISDTHGVLRPEAAEVLKSCEIIFHAGDIGKPEILTRLKAIADTYAVLGNVDQACADQFQFSSNGFSEKIPEELEVEFYGFRIYMLHNKKQLRKDLSKVDIVIYGHSHKYEETRHGNTIWLNPGSCGPRRFRLPVTMMLLTLHPAEHRLETEKIDCLSVSFDNEEVKIPEQDMHRLVREIMREVDAGKNIADIAVRNQIDEKFAEQVCRMYVTHPGVNVEGILDRIERRNL